MFQWTHCVIGCTGIRERMPSDDFCCYVCKVQSNDIIEVFLGDFYMYILCPDCFARCDVSEFELEERVYH